jgi:hypothetical protein
VQNQPFAWVNVHLGLGVDSHCQSQRREGIAPEEAQFAITFTELPLQRGP